MQHLMEQLKQQEQELDLFNSNFETLQKDNEELESESQKLRLANQELSS